jgi:hypothetical protein
LGRLCSSENPKEAKFGLVVSFVKKMIKARAKRTLLS